MPAKSVNLPSNKQSTILNNDETVHLPLQSLHTKQAINTAIVYCEGNFAAIDGKTANGLVRSSEKYKILCIIDSEKAGLDTGMILDEKTNGIPVCRDLTDALAHALEHVTT